jgi:hypothetical protein
VLNAAEVAATDVVGDTAVFTITVGGDQEVTGNAKTFRRVVALVREHGADAVAVVAQGKLVNGKLEEAGITGQLRASKPAAPPPLMRREDVPPSQSSCCCTRHQPRGLQGQLQRPAPPATMKPSARSRRLSGAPITSSGAARIHSRHRPASHYQRASKRAGPRSCPTAGSTAQVDAGEVIRRPQKKKSFASGRGFIVQH